MNRILLVDDEPEILRAVEEFLTRNGFDVVCALEGQKAIDLIDSGARVDMAVLDVKMPGMNGFDTLREIRKRREGLPALFLTGSINKMMHYDDLRSLGYDIDDILQKPVNLNELIKEIKKRLGP